MALTRKFLKALGIEDAAIDEIITAHSDTVNALKDEIKSADGLKEENEKLKKEKEKIQKELDGATDSDRIAELEKEIEGYKSKEILTNKRSVYAEMLKELNIDEKRIESILNITNFDNVELDDKNAIKGIEDIKKSVEKDFSAFIVKQEEKGTPPPKNDNENGGNENADDMSKLSMAEYIKARNEQKNI